VAVNPLGHPGAHRAGPVDLAAAGRILAVRADNIGDVVVVTPALAALRAAAPHARLDLLASPAGASVVPMIPELDGVLAVSPSWQQLGDRPDCPARERELLDRLTAARYDVMVVFTSFSQSPWPVAHLGLLAGIGTRVLHSREFGGAVATHWVTPPPDTTHLTDRALHLLAAVGIPDRGRLPSLRVPAEAERGAEAALAGIDAPFAVLAPGASCPSRRYPAELFGAAAAELARGGLPVLVGGPAGENALVAAVVAHAGTPGVTALPPVPLPVFTAVLRRAAVAVTNNSGGMHLADAVGTPVAVAFAGTERAGDIAPRSVPSALLARPVPCSPCRQLTCPYELVGAQGDPAHPPVVPPCLAVPPAALAAAARRLTASRAGRSGSHTPSPEETRWMQPV